EEAEGKKIEVVSVSVSVCHYSHSTIPFTSSCIPRLLPLPLTQQSRLSLLNLCQQIHPLHSFPPGLLPLVIDYVSVDAFIGTGSRGEHNACDSPRGITMI